MDPLLNVLITAALIGVLAFLASLVVRFRQGLFGSVGAGFIGAGVGNWISGLIHVPEPLPIAVRTASVNVVWTFVGSLLVLLLARVILRGRSR